MDDGMDALAAAGYHGSYRHATSSKESLLLHYTHRIGLYQREAVRCHVVIGAALSVERVEAYPCATVTLGIIEHIFNVGAAFQLCNDVASSLGSHTFTRAPFSLAILIDVIGDEAHKFVRLK